MAYKNKVLILGIGNYLMGDEGIGVHIAERLEKEKLPLEVDVLDGGTGGFHLLEYFELYPNVILIDATLDSNPPGTIRLIKPKFAKDFPQAMSTHDIGLKDMVSALQIMGTIPDIDLFVISIESIQQQGITLTPQVEAVVPLIMDQVKELMHVLLASEKVLN